MIGLFLLDIDFQVSKWWWLELLIWKVRIVVQDCLFRIENWIRVINVIGFIGLLREIKIFLYRIFDTLEYREFLMPTLMRQDLYTDRGFIVSQSDHARNKNGR